MKLNFLVAAAILLPAAAVAQESQPPAAGTTQATPPQSTPPGQAGTTEQAAPAQPDSLAPATSVQTPTAEAPAKGPETALAKVTKADVKAGAKVYDSSGGSVGKIDSVTASGAVLNTGKVQVTIPISSLAKNDKGLVIGMTKSEIEAAAKKS